MGPLPKIERGDPIKAAWLNKLAVRAELGGMVRGAGAATVGFSTTGIRTKVPFGGGKVIPFETYEGLIYPETATLAPYTTQAKRLYLTPGATANEYQAEVTGTTILYYPQASRNDNGDYTGFPVWKSGMIVYAIQNRQSGRWEVVSVEATYDRCNALLKGALDTGDSTTTVDNVVATRGPSPLDDPTDATEELTVSNYFAWDGDDNAPCKIEYNEDNENWEMYQVKCPA